MIDKQISNENSIEIKDKTIAEKLTPSKLEDRMKEALGQHVLGNDPNAIFTSIRKEHKNTKGHLNTSIDSNLYKALTLFEFDKGILMSSAIPERYISFCIDFFRKLQKEYQCEAPSEKATAELVAINFVRTLEIQSKINAYLGKDEFSDMGVRYLAVLSKELDKANRHYLNSLQTLKMFKQPPLEVNIKTQTAIVGQNQIVQSNNK